MPTPEPSFPLALKPPFGEVIELTDELIDAAVFASRESPRRRIILPFHERDDSTLHRMLNAVQPGSYIRPHRHSDPPKDEGLVLLRGALVFFTFDEQGTISSIHRAKAGTAKFGIDVKAGVVHTFIATEPDTVVYEVKPGPWSPATDKDFALWAPKESDPGVGEFMNELLRAAAE